MTIRDNFLNCYEKLDKREIDYSKGPQKQGVSKPITLDLPLDGIAYFQYPNSTQQSTLFMDCELALALHEAGKVLKSMGIGELSHMGVYNYRCIAGTGKLPDCTLSPHAYGTAIDFAEFRSDSETYNVEDDWVPDGESDDTCTADTSNAKDALLHDLACAWHEDAIFNIILTPNYNEAYSNHVHGDLTEAKPFIE